MNEWLPIALAGFGIAFFHAAIPTHWLPFVITARAQRWDRNKAIGVTALAGTGHVLFTALLGVLIAWFGIELHQRIGSWFPWIAGGALLVFGLFYVYRQMSGGGHGHSHLFGGHSHHGATPHLHTHAPHSGSPSPGRHGGRVIDTGSGEIELAVSHDGGEARFRLYPVDSRDQPMAQLHDDTITLETIGPTQRRTIFNFRNSDGCLESTQTIAERHDDFTAVLRLTHGDHVHAFETRFARPSGSVGETVDIVTSRARIPDRVAITSLLALLTFSPCESFLPVYVSGVRYGWIGFFLLTAILSIATVAGMVLFTWMTLSKLEKLNLRFLERYENGIIGGLLCTLGVLIILIER